MAAQGEKLSLGSVTMEFYIFSHYIRQGYNLSCESITCRAISLSQAQPLRLLLILAFSTLVWKIDETVLRFITASDIDPAKSELL